LPCATRAVPAHVIGGAVTHSAAHEASLSLTSRTDRGGYAIAALSGDLGIASASALREQLRSLLRAASQLIIDLSAVERADASGLAVLVGSGHCADGRLDERPHAAAGATLRLAGAAQAVTRDGHRSRHPGRQPSRHSPSGLR